MSKFIRFINEGLYCLYHNPQVPLFASGFFFHFSFVFPTCSLQIPKWVPIRLPICSLGSQCVPQGCSQYCGYITCHTLVKKSALDPNTRTKMILEKLIPTQHNNGSFPPCFEPHHHHHHSSSKEAMHRIALHVLITLVSKSMSSTKHSVFIHSQKYQKLTSDNM